MSWQEVERYLRNQFDVALNRELEVPLKSRLGATDIRKQDKPLGRIVADAMKWKAKKHVNSLSAESYFCKKDVEFAFINSGGIRDGLPAQNVKVGTLHQIFFDNKIAIFEIPAKELLKIFSIMGKQLYPYSQPDHNGSFLQVSGIRLKIGANKREEAYVVENMKVNNKTITRSDNQFIIGVTNDYLLPGNVHRYTPMQSVIKSGRWDVIESEFIYDIFREYITSGEFEPIGPPRIMINHSSKTKDKVE